MLSFIFYSCCLIHSLPSILQNYSTITLYLFFWSSECRKCTGEDADVTLVATKMEIKDQSGVSTGRSKRALVMSFNKGDATLNKVSELSVGTEN